MTPADRLNRTLDLVYNALSVSSDLPSDNEASGSPAGPIGDRAGGAGREETDNLNHSRHWSLPDINGYPVGSAKAVTLELIDSGER